MGSRSVVPLLYASRAGAARMAGGRSLVVARPQVAAAIRIPERVGAQLRLVFPSAVPRLFVHEGARQALERKLRVAFPGPVILSITDNRHSIITHRVQKGVLHARIHHMFLDAPAAVVDALVRYVTRGRPRRERHARRLHRRRTASGSPAASATPRSSPRASTTTCSSSSRRQRPLLRRRRQRPHHVGQAADARSQGQPQDDQARKLQRRRPADPRPPRARPEMGAPLLRGLHRLPRDAPSRDPRQPRPRARQPAPAGVQGA